MNVELITLILTLTSILKTKNKSIFKDIRFIPRGGRYKEFPYLFLLLISAVFLFPFLNLLISSVPKSTIKTNINETNTLI